MSVIKEIIEYRDMIFSLVRRDLRGRYQKSVLGVLWNFLNPLFQIVVYAVVFVVIFKSSIENYYIYLAIGIVPWTFFSESLAQGASSIVGNAEMVKKIYFPREVLTLSTVLSRLINMVLSFLIVFIFIIFSGVGISVSTVWMLPIVWILQTLLITGIALLLASVTVYFRDMEYITGVILMAWIWATPILYDITTLPEVVQKVLMINPMTLIVMMYHDILYYKVMPSVDMLLVALIEGVVVLVIGEFIFRKIEANFAEEF